MAPTASATRIVISSTSHRDEKSDLLKGLQDVYWSDDEEEDPECPLCMEEMDLSDINFKPCPCGYQICRFCHHHIIANLNKRCPACRREYSEEGIEFTPVSPEEIKRLTALKKTKAKVNKELESLGRRHLKDVRIIVKSMVFVVGMGVGQEGRAEEQLATLRSNDYFGQYGKISKLILHKRPSSSTPSSANSPNVGIYISYLRREDAARAIAALDGFPSPSVPGQVLRASYGTAKYCENWLRNAKCENSSCMGLHDWGDERDCFTRDDLATLNYTMKDTERLQKAVSTATSSRAKKMDELTDASALPRTASWGSRPGTGLASLPPNPTLPAPNGSSSKTPIPGASSSTRVLPKKNVVVSLASIGATTSTPSPSPSVSKSKTISLSKASGPPPGLGKEPEGSGSRAGTPVLSSAKLSAGSSSSGMPPPKSPRPVIVPSPRPAVTSVPSRPSTPVITSAPPPGLTLFASQPPSAQTSPVPARAIPQIVATASTPISSLAPASTPVSVRSDTSPAPSTQSSPLVPVAVPEPFQPTQSSEQAPPSSFQPEPSPKLHFQQPSPQPQQPLPHQQQQYHAYQPSSHTQALVSEVTARREAPPPTLSPFPDLNKMLSTFEDGQFGFNLHLDEKVNLPRNRPHPSTGEESHYPSTLATGAGFSPFGFALPMSNVGRLPMDLGVSAPYMGSFDPFGDGGQGSMDESGTTKRSRFDFARRRPSDRSPLPNLVGLPSRENGEERSYPNGAGGDEGLLMFPWSSHPQGASSSTDFLGRPDDHQSSSAQLPPPGLAGFSNNSSLSHPLSRQPSGSSFSSALPPPGLTHKSQQPLSHGASSSTNVNPSNPAVTATTPTPTPSANNNGSNWIHQLSSTNGNPSLGGTVESRESRMAFARQQQQQHQQHIQQQHQQLGPQQPPHHPPQQGAYGMTTDRASQAQTLKEMLGVGMMGMNGMGMGGMGGMNMMGMGSNDHGMNQIPFQDPAIMSMRMASSQQQQQQQQPQQPPHSGFPNNYGPELGMTGISGTSEPIGLGSFPFASQGLSSDSARNARLLQQLHQQQQQQSQSQPAPSQPNYFNNGRAPSPSATTVVGHQDVVNPVFQESDFPSLPIASVKPTAPTPLSVVAAVAEHARPEKSTSSLETKSTDLVLSVQEKEVKPKVGLVEMTDRVEQLKLEDGPSNKQVDEAEKMPKKQVASSDPTIAVQEKTKSIAPKVVENPVDSSVEPPPFVIYARPVTPPRTKSRKELRKIAKANGGSPVAKSTDSPVPPSSTSPPKVEDSIQLDQTLPLSLETLLDQACVGLDYSTLSFFEPTPSKPRPVLQLEPEALSIAFGALNGPNDTVLDEAVFSLATLLTMLSSNISDFLNVLPSHQPSVVDSGIVGRIGAAFPETLRHGVMKRRIAEGKVPISAVVDPDPVSSWKELSKCGLETYLKGTGGETLDELKTLKAAFVKRVGHLTGQLESLHQEITSIALDSLGSSSCPRITQTSKDGPKSIAQLESALAQANLEVESTTKELAEVKERTRRLFGLKDRDVKEQTI